MTTKRDKGNLVIAGIDAGQILRALEQRHKDDVFVDECKNGPTWDTHGLLKLDAWVLARSYSPLRMIGYEIKCSRQDFEQDQKWTGYLDLCHQFYFVCPAGLIRATDLPQEIGLIWMSASGKLVTKRKPEWRQPDQEKIIRLLVYVVMARSKIMSSMYELNRQDPPDPGKARLDAIRSCVEINQESKTLADFVKGHVREIYDETMQKHYSLEKREKLVKEFTERLAVLGIKWDPNSNQWYEEQQVRSQIDILRGNISSFVIGDMKRVGQNLIDTAKEIEGIHNKMEAARNPVL